MLKAITYKKRKTKKVKGIMVFFFIIFSTYSFTLVFPFLWIFYNSFKTAPEFLMSGNPWALPQKFLISNYFDVFVLSEFNLGVMFFNSATLVVGQTLAGLLVSCCTAYAVAKYKFLGRNTIYFIAVTIMFIPTTGSIAVTYKLIVDLKLYDTYLGMIIMSAGGFGFSFFLLYGFFKNISWSYAEAAFIDGAGHWRVFLRIMLPQARPALTALAIISGIGVWNDFSSQYIFYKGHPTVAVGLKRLSDYIVSYGADYPRYFAAIIMSTLPVIIVYASCQKMILQNTVAGGLKG